MSPNPSDAGDVTEDVLTATATVGSPSLGKRKAEAPASSSDEGDESESSMVVSEDSESKPETEPLWGYDSFEEKDYFSYSEDELAEAFSDPECVKPALDYRRQIHLTRGFEVDPERVPPDMITGYFPIDLNDTLFGWKSPDGTARGYMERMVGLALDKLNQTQRSDVKMDHVVRAIARKSAGIKCYITFMARETPNGPLVEYQASGKYAKFTLIQSFADQLLHPSISRRRLEEAQGSGQKNSKLKTFMNNIINC